MIQLATNWIIQVVGTIMIPYHLDTLWQTNWEIKNPWKVTYFYGGFSIAKSRLPQGTPWYSHHDRLVAPQAQHADPAAGGMKLQQGAEKLRRLPPLFISARPSAGATGFVHHGQLDLFINRSKWSFMLNNKWPWMCRKLIHNWFDFSQWISWSRLNTEFIGWN